MTCSRQGLTHLLQGFSCHCHRRHDDRTVNVSGTISDPSWAVWVNGRKASNPGNGTWTATSVPVTQGGAAVFQMTAYSPEEQQPDGSHGN